MKCLDCGMDMEEGIVEGIGQGWGHGYEFVSNEEKAKKGVKGFFTKRTINITSSTMESPAWHCPHCKKVLMWMYSKE